MGPVCTALIFLIPSVQWALSEGHWHITQRSTSFGPSVLKLKSSSYLVPRLSAFFVGPLSRQAVCHSPRGHGILPQATSSSKQSWCQIACLQLCPPDFTPEEAHGISNAFLILANTELTLWNRLQVYSTSLREPSRSPKVWAEGGIGSAKAGDPVRASCLHNLCLDLLMPDAHFFQMMDCCYVHLI